MKPLSCRTLLCSIVCLLIIQHSTTAQRRQQDGKGTSSLGRRTSSLGRRTQSTARRTPLSSRRTSLPDRITPLPDRITPLPGRRTSLPGRRTSLPGRRTSLPGRRTSLLGRKTSLPGRTSPREENQQQKIKRINKPTGIDVQSHFQLTRSTSDALNSHSVYSFNRHGQRSISDSLLDKNAQLRLNYPSNSPAFGRIYFPTISNNRKEYSKPPLSGEWVRLRASDKINSGLVQVYRAGKWGYVCDDRWDIEDGSVACRQMGFTRGAGAVTGLNETLPKTEWGLTEILMDETECTGNEKALQLCKYNANHDCSLSEVASVLCLPNKGCPDGWVSGYGKCYKFFKDAKNFQNAHNFCAKKNAGLVNIQSKSENHFLSNILKNLKKDIHQWYTAGRKDNQEWKWWKAGNKTSRTVRSIGADTLWFPGWPSENNSLWEPKDDPTYSCLTLSDEFRSPHNSIENVDYFFWKADICENPKGINFICEMGIETQSVNECYTDNGSNYRGFATTTERGTQCLSWADSKKVNDRTNPGKGLGDHNYCRNPDNDARPWCWTDHGLLKFGFCKLDKCSEVIDYVATSSSSQNLGEALNCPPEEFYCHKQKKCIPKAFHCDKDFDCELGEDEEGCEYASEKFDKTKGVTLLLSNTSSQFIFASYINVTDEKCAKECLASTQYICRSFVYNVRSLKCDLSQYNTQNGSIIESTAYDFYEMISQ
ncbi:hypothetical protein Btru_036778, partial [Bulinus truncatus]